MKLATAAIALLLFAAPLAGCLKKDTVQSAVVEQKMAEEILGTCGRQAIVDAASLVP